MSTSTVFRAALPGFVLMVAGGVAHAQAAQDCRDATLAPTAQRAACDEAIEAATDPLERARLLVQRAQTYRREQNMGGLEAALADLAEAERLAPDADPQLRVDLLVERAELRRVQGDFEAALADIEEAERLAPTDADPAINRALVLSQQGDFEGALAEIARARELEPDHVRAHVDSMWMLSHAGDFETCVELGNRAVELAPSEAGAWSLRGLCQANLGRAEQAVADLEEAARLGPEIVGVQEEIADAYLALERPEEALAAARRAVGMDPAYPGTQMSLVNALIATGAPDEAIAAYREAQAAGVEDPTGQANNIAWSLYMAGEHDKALPIVEEWLAANPEPTDGDFYYYMLDTAAHVMAAAGQADEAVDVFLRAAELGGPEWRAMYEEQLTALGHTSEAGDEGFEAALRACVATGEACKLFPQ